MKDNGNNITTERQQTAQNEVLNRPEQEHPAAIETAEVFLDLNTRLYLVKKLG